MPDLVLDAVINKEWQGWFGSSTSGSNSSIQMNFSNSYAKKKGNFDPNNITISSVKLQFNCTKSGKSAAKSFKITFKSNYLTTTKTNKGQLSGDNGSETGAYAYNHADNGTYPSYVNFSTTEISNILNWIKAGAQDIYSTDPTPTNYRSTTVDGVKKYYSENYVKFRYAQLVITYTVNATSLSSEPGSLTFGTSKTLSWSPSDTTYTHDIKLVSNGVTQNLLLKNVAQSDVTLSGNSITFKPSTSIASKIPTKTSTTGSLTIETFNSSGTSLGKKTY